MKMHNKSEYDIKRGKNDALFSVFPALLQFLFSSRKTTGTEQDGKEGVKEI